MEPKVYKQRLPKVRAIHFDPDNPLALNLDDIHQQAIDIIDALRTYGKVNIDHWTLEYREDEKSSLRVRGESAITHARADLEITDGETIVISSSQQWTDSNGCTYRLPHIQIVPTDKFIGEWELE